jgi:hypothetical protein
MRDGLHAVTSVGVPPSENPVRQHLSQSNNGDQREYQEKTPAHLPPCPSCLRG